MKTPFITIILSLLFLACENSPRGKINSVNISDTQHPETKVEFTATPALNQKSEILISSGQSSPFTNLQINGCNFDLVYDNGDTIYLATTDMNFRTTEGYKIGTKFTDLPKIIQNKLTKEPGWGYFFKLNSGWFLGFCEGESCTDYYPTGNSRVKWIFKRR